MQEIIYSSNNIIPWDTQSAFKIYNYYTEVEAHRIFCYLKQYVYENNFKFCTYCFNKADTGAKSIQLAINFNPLLSNNYLHVTFGVDGIDSAFIVCDDDSIVQLDTTDIVFTTFTSDDEQGHYWCFEGFISKDFILKHFKTTLIEKSIISLNMYKIFENSTDFACLFEAKHSDLTAKAKELGQFLILNY